MDWPEVTKYKDIASAQEHRKKMILNLYTLKHDPQKDYSYGTSSLYVKTSYWISIIYDEKFSSLILKK